MRKECETSGKRRRAPEFAPAYSFPRMKRVIDVSEILGTIDLPAGTNEVCATAEASYDESSSRLTVSLAAFLRPVDLLAAEKHLGASWLPKPQTASEAVSLDEAGEVAREIFHRWTRKVREAAPALHRPTF